MEIVVRIVLLFERETSYFPYIYIKQPNLFLFISIMMIGNVVAAGRQAIGIGK